MGLTGMMSDSMRWDLGKDPGKCDGVMIVLYLRRPSRVKCCFLPA